MITGRLIRFAAVCGVFATAATRSALAQQGPDGAFAAVQSLTREADADDRRLAELGNEIRKQSQSLSELRAERETALQELRQGLYCSRCGRPKSQIEREEHMPFSQHLQNVQGTAIPASQAMIDAKAKEYDQKISAASLALEKLMGERDRLQRNRDDLVARRLPLAVLAWRDAVNAAETARLQQWQAENARLGAEIERAKRAFFAARSEAERAQYRGLIAGYFDQRERGEFTFNTDRAAFEQQKNQGLKQVSDALSRLGGPMMVAGITSLIGVPDVPLKGKPLSASVGFDQLVVSGSLGSVKSYLEVKSNWFQDEMSVRMGLEAFGFSAGMERRTVYGPNGVRIEDEPFVRTPSIVRPR